MSEAGIGESEGLALVFLEGRFGDVVTAGAGEGTGLDGGIRSEERRGVGGGGEAEGSFAVGGISTVGGGRSGEMGAGMSGGVSSGGEPEDVEDWKRCDLRRLTGGGTVG